MPAPAFYTDGTSVIYRDGRPLYCDNGSSIALCLGRPAVTIRDSVGVWLGVICEECATRMTKKGLVIRANPYCVKVKGERHAV